MSGISAAVVVMVFFVPPISLATRLPALAGSVWALSGSLLVSWLVLWWVPAFVIRLANARSANRWLDRLVWAAHPQLAMRFVVLLSLLILLLAAGGLSLINILCKTLFALDRNSVILVGFALLVELGRLFEAAARDELAWVESERQLRSARQ